MVWKTARADEKLALVRDINKVETAYKFSPDETDVGTLELPFYPGGRLVSVARPSVKGPPLWYVRLPQETVALDGSVANIHHLNAAAPIKLSAQNIADYLKFRLYFAKQGWLEGVVASETNGSFHATARITDKDGLYEATLNISSRGEVGTVQRDKIGPAAKQVPAAFSF